MASLKVICPKCFKGQQVVVDIPAAGLEHVCIFCKSTFRVKPPARPSSDDLPAAREAIPRPTDLPTPREGVPHPTDLPAPREAIPRPTDLPAPREAIPRPTDLPVSRDAVPRPGDLPISRDAAPRPGDLPVSRDSVPRPGDLPISRDAAPRPGDLPISRNSVPRPGDLPVDRAAVPKPGPAARPFLPGNRAAGSERTKTPPLGLALDLSNPLLPVAGPQPLQLDDPDSLELALPDLPPPPVAAPPKASVAPAAGAEPLDRTPPRHAGAAAGAPAIPATTRKPPPVPAPRTAPSLAPLVAQPAESLFQFDEAPPPPGPPAPVPAPVDVRPARAEGKAHGGPRENLDLGFSLELEGDARASKAAAPSAIPFPAARMANDGTLEGAGKEDVPALAPPTTRPAGSARALRPVARRMAVPRWALFAASGAAVAVVAALVLLPVLRSAPSPETVLKPFAAELAKDAPGAYRNAAEQLERAAAAFKEGGARLQLSAAELLLMAYTVHGGQTVDLARAEQLMQAAAGKPKLAAALGQARALLAIAKGKAREAEAALADRATPESQRTLGIAALAQGKASAAVSPLRQYVAARSGDALGHYLLGKALVTTNAGDARKEFAVTLVKNPAHAGAQIGIARLEETPEKRFAAATALAERKDLAAGPSELADLYTAIGLAAQALGRTPVAIDAFQKAIANDKQRTDAVVALGESLLYEGSYAAALEKLKAGGAAVEASPAGKFCLGGAYIATGSPTQGLALVSAASKEKPDDPRGPFWTGFAAHLKYPADLSAAEQGYRDAIKHDPRFLPASLKLATLLQQKAKAEESLTVLRAAEEAGAPPAVLQLAWGEALIVAKEAAKAEDVFQRALDNDPKNVSARLGIAAALEAQGKLAEAKASLAGSLKAAPETIGLRERLAQVCLKLGEQDEALGHYQDEIRIHPSIGARLAAARVALALGKIELAQSEAKKVLAEAPRNAEAAYDLARVNESRRDYGAALQEYRHATTWGNTPRFALDYGRLLDKLGKQSEALASLANAVSLPEGRMERGRIYFRAGDLEGALGDFQVAAKMTPEEAEPLVLQGLCYDKLGQGKKAEEAWHAALKADPDSPEPHYRLGRTELDHGKTGTAIEHFRKAAAKVPTEADWRADLYFQLAQAEVLSGAKAAALVDFKKFLDLAPDNAPTRPEATQQVARLSGGRK